MEAVVGAGQRACDVMKKEFEVKAASRGVALKLRWKISDNSEPIVHMTPPPRHLTTFIHMMTTHIHTCSTNSSHMGTKKSSQLQVAIAKKLD